MSVECEICGHTKSFCYCTEDLTKVLGRCIIEPELRGGLLDRLIDNMPGQIEMLLDALHDISLLAAEESEWEGDAYADIRDRAMEAQREYERWEREGENQDA